MPRRAAYLTQADVARVIRAAKQVGAAQVEVKISDQATIVVRLQSTDHGIPLAPRDEVIL